MKDVNAGLLSSLERSKTTSDAQCSSVALLNAQLTSEVAQMRAAIASKEEHISKLKVRTTALRVLLYIAPRVYFCFCFCYCFCFCSCFVFVVLF